jgi:hypothetical protein
LFGWPNSAYKCGVERNPNLLFIVPKDAGQSMEGSGEDSKEILVGWFV